MFDPNCLTVKCDFSYPVISKHQTDHPIIAGRAAEKRKAEKAANPKTKPKSKAKRAKVEAAEPPAEEVEWPEEWPEEDNLEGESDPSNDDQ